MDDPGSALASSANNNKSRILTWAVSLVASAYFVWLGGSLFYATPIFLNMYGSMGVELPLQTRLLISFRWLYLLLFIGGIAVVIAKQFYVRDKWRNLAITFAFVAVIEVLSDAMFRALYAPLFTVIEKLSK